MRTNASAGDILNSKVTTDTKAFSCYHDFDEYQSNLLIPKNTKDTKFKTYNLVNAQGFQSYLCIPMVSKVTYAYPGYDWMPKDSKVTYAYPGFPKLPMHTQNTTAYSWYESILILPRHPLIPKENKDTKAYSLWDFRFFPHISPIFKNLMLQQFLKFFADISRIVF